MASRATSGIQKLKWLARTFERPSSTGDTATKSSIGDSDKISRNMTCRIKLLDSTACIKRSQELRDLINVADGIDLIFRYRRLWTQDNMKREAPVAVSILGVIRDLQKVCQANDWLFEDRAPFLAYKVDLLLRRHQLRGLRGTSRLGYKRYGCAPHRTQDLAVQLQEYF